MTDKHYADCRWTLRSWTASDSYGWHVDIPGERCIDIDAQSERAEALREISLKDARGAVAWSIAEDALAEIEAAEKDGEW